MRRIDLKTLIGWFWQLYQLLYQVWETSSDRHVGLIAAGVAFFGMFAIFPGLAAIIAIFGLLADPVVVAEQLNIMKDVIPAQAFSIISDQIDRLLSTTGGTLGWTTVVSIALALWAARAGVAGLMGGLNAIADRPPRNGFKQIVVALILTIVLVSLALAAMTLTVVAPIVLSHVPTQSGSALILEILRWVVALFVLFAALSLLYRFGPNQRGGRMRWVTVGAATVIILWMAASTGLSYYLANFNSYNEVYGSIGAVIAMLLWLYISAYLIMLGAALNPHVHGSIVGRDEYQKT